MRFSSFLISSCPLSAFPSLDRFDRAPHRTLARFQMAFAVGVNLVSLQFGMFLGRGQHYGSAVLVNTLGDLTALLLLVPKQFAEHSFDVFERMIIAVPQQNIVARLPASFSLHLPFFLRHYRGDTALVLKFGHPILVSTIAVSPRVPRWCNLEQGIILDAPGRRKLLAEFLDRRSWFLLRPMPKSRLRYPRVPP